MPKTIFRTELPLATGETTSAAPFRLTIAHLLLWTAATGFVLAIFPKDWLRAAIHGRNYTTLSRQVDRRQVVEKWSVVAVAPFYGAAIISVAIAGTRLIQRRAGFPEQPGHWLLVQAGLGVLAASCFVTSSSDVASFSMVTIHAARRNFGAAVFVVLACLAATGIAASQSTSEPSRWRVFFQAHLVSTIAPLITFLLVTFDSAQAGAAGFLLWLTIGPWTLSAAAALLLGCFDLLRRTRHDLFHWTGLIAPAAILLHPPLTRWLAAIWL